MGSPGVNHDCLYPQTPGAYDPAPPGDLHHQLYRDQPASGRLLDREDPGTRVEGDTVRGSSSSGKSGTASISPCTCSTGFGSATSSRATSGAHLNTKTRRRSHRRTSPLDSPIPSDASLHVVDCDPDRDLLRTGQYTIGDQVFSFLGYIGMSLPNFLMALIFMYVSVVHLGWSVGGLFFPQPKLLKRRT